MRSGFPELLSEGRWLGRRYAGGMVLGLWIGFLLGLLLKDDLRIPEHSSRHFFLVVLISPLVGVASRWITGNLPKLDAANKRDEG